MKFKAAETGDNTKLADFKVVFFAKKYFYLLTAMLTCLHAVLILHLLNHAVDGHCFSTLLVLCEQPKTNFGEVEDLRRQPTVELLVQGVDGRFPHHSFTVLRLVQHLQNAANVKDEERYSFHLHCEESHIWQSKV